MDGENNLLLDRMGELQLPGGGSIVADAAKAGTTLAASQMGELQFPDLTRAAQRATVAVPKNADESDYRVRAKTISEAMGRAIAIAKREAGDKADTDEVKDSKARAHADAIGMLLTGKHDYNGAMWTPDRRGFESGAAYFQHMRNLVLNGPAASLTEDYKRFMEADYDEQCRIAAEKEAVWDKTVRAGGDAASWLWNMGAVETLPREIEREAPEEVRNANATLFVRDIGGTKQDPEKVKAAEETVRKYREERRREEIRAKYEAKLNRENAWNALTTILPALSEDAQKCAKALMDSDDNALPVDYWAKFNALPERDRELIVQTRSMMKPEVESGFWNTIGDMGVGAANITMNIASAPVRQVAKAINMSRNGAVDAGIDVNALARRRQLLWQATGNLFAGADVRGLQLPQLQFENFCEEHGFVGNALIGAVSTLPYMAAAAIPYAGTALVALEAMQEFDDHVAMNGGDITDGRYIASSALLGALYAYIEKLQLEGLVGGVSEQKLREATLKGLFKGAEARLAVGRTIFAGTLSESLQEGLQNGIMAVNEALALKGDAVRAFGEGFTEDFIGSLGTMFVIEAGGVVAGHLKRSGFRLGVEGQTNRSNDLTTLLTSQFAHQSMVDQSARSAEWHAQAETRRYMSLFGFWRDGGMGALIEKGGASRDEAERLDALFRELRATEGARASGEAAEGEYVKGGGDMAAVEALLEQLQNGNIERDMFIDALRINGFSEQGAADYAAMLDANASIAEKYEAWSARFQAENRAKEETDERKNEAYARVLDAINDLSWARGVWAKGAGVIAVSEGKVEDPGAAALQAAGFAENDARTLSKLFHEERANAHSPATLEGVRALYDAATRGRLGATAALERDFGGRMVRLQVGMDKDGNPEYGSFIRFKRSHTEERTAEDGTKTTVRIEDPDGLVRVVETDLPAVDHTNTSDEVAASVEEATKALKTPITREMWKGATDAQRRKWVRDYRLQDEGGFALYAPNDPSAKIDANGAGQIVGEIRIGANSNFGGRIGTSSVFHEVFHAWARFMYQSGIWTDKDVKRLVERFGKPRTAGELFNEEAAANEFRAYVSRRMAGAMSENDEKDGVFRKLFRLARGVKAKAAEQAVQAEVATTAAEAFFDQIIADLYKDIPDFTADERRAKPKVETTGGGEAPNMPGKGKAGTESAESETKKTESETGTGETETKKPETGTLAPTRAGAAATGWSAATPTGNVRVSGHWAVFDLSELIHSNNPLYAKYMRNQLRNRKSNKAEEDARENIIRNFDAARLFEAPDTANGAPIVFIDVDDEGKTHPYILSGNGRVLVLNAMAERHLFDKYRNFMKSWAAENGLDVGDGENKVIVRVIDDYGGATREQVADLSNTNSIQQYTEEEQARADAEVIKNLSLARLYRSNADGSPDMTPGANDEFFMRFIQATGDTALYNADRTITETARNRVQRALLAIAVGQGDRGREVVKKLVDRSETLGINRQKNALAVMAADVAALESSADYAIGPDVSRAVADFIDFIENRDTGKKWGTIENYLAQQSLLDGPSEVARSILAILGSRQSAADMAEYIRQYCDAAMQEDPTGGLFGADAARTRTDIWRDAKRTVDERRAKAAEAEKELAAKRHSVVAADDYFTGRNRQIAHGLKMGDGIAIRLAAQQMAAMLPDDAAIVPMPSSRGDAGTALLLARQIARFSGRPVIEALAGRSRESLYAAKKEGRLPASEALGFRKVREIPKGLVPWVVDNVYSTGTTAKAAQLALEGAHVLAFADASEEAFDLFGTPRLRHSVGAITPEEDAKYADAVKRGDIATARQMERDAYLRAGYSEDSSYQGTSAFNGPAPSRNAYFETKAERIEATKNGEMEDTTTLGDFRDGIDLNNLQFIVFDPRSERNADPMRQEAIRNVRGVLEGGKDTITMYRSVPSDIKESEFRNGDWITPSRAYAEDNARIHGWGSKFRVIEQEVSIEDVWWDGNDIAEWGFDDGKESVYKNTAANRKLVGPTYDDNGNLIPLSKRFNDWRMDSRYSIASRLEAEREELEAKGGRLVLAHHGTDSAGFTVFEKSDAKGYFFSKSRTTAGSYIRKGHRSDVNKKALPDYQQLLKEKEDEGWIERGFALVNKDGSLTGELGSRYGDRVFADRETAQMHSVGREVVEALSYNDELYRADKGIPYSALLNDGEQRSGVYDVALRMEDPYVIDGRGANWDHIIDWDAADRDDVTVYDKIAIEAEEGHFYLKMREYGHVNAEYESFATLEDAAEWAKKHLGETVAERISDFAETNPEDGDSKEIANWRSPYAWDSSNDDDGWYLPVMNTREVVDMAFDMGCDGVIFRNIVDNGGGVVDAYEDEVYVVKDAKQVKLVDEMAYADDGSIIPAEERLNWSNEDMRYSVAAEAQNGVMPVQVERETPEARHSIFAGAIGARRGKFALERLAKAVEMLDGERDIPPTRRAEIFRKTGWWQGADGKLRVELPHPKAKSVHSGDILSARWEDGREGRYIQKLQSLVGAPELFKAYPELADMNVWIIPDSRMPGINAMYFPSEGRWGGWNHVMTVSESSFTGKPGGDGAIKLTERGTSSVAHELQHAVQLLENFAYGGSPSVYPKTYDRLAGEVEARNAARRRRLADMRRLPSETEDVPRNRQVVVDLGRGGVVTDATGRRIPAKAWETAHERFSFAIGEVGATNLDDALFLAGSLNAAREMLAGRDWEKIKKDEQLKIKLATSWEKGADGKWRHETDDIPELNLSRLKKPNTAQGEGKPKYLPVKLADVFTKKIGRELPLFKAYPWLKDATVQYGAPIGRSRGSLTESGGGKFTISISEEQLPDAEGVRKTLIHEIQHAIQRIEGFARGGNAELMEKLFLRKFDEARDAARKWHDHYWALLRRHDRWVAMRYTNYPRKHPVHIEAAREIEGDPDWPKLEDERREFRKKWGHDPKYFIDSDWGAFRKAARTGFQDYRKLAGEVEARNASERTANDITRLWSDTEDVARKSQILLGAGAQLMQRVVEAEDARARSSFASLRADSLAGIKSVDDAEVMERRGDDRETIFRLTGWWRAADGKWRVELPFHGRFTYKGDFNGRKGYLDSFWDWPELFELYPELKNTVVSFVPASWLGGAEASYTESENAIWINDSLKEAPLLPSLFVHEIQHAIQEIEGLATGGSPSEFLQYDASDRRSIRDMAQHYRERLDEALANGEDESEIASLRSALADFQSQVDEFDSDSENARSKYDHLAGEVEARNAAERFFMSPEERLERPPWMTQDWSDETQIVRFSEPRRYSLAAIRSAPRLDTYMDVNDFAHNFIFSGSPDDRLPEHRYERDLRADRYCSLDYTPSFWVIALNRNMKPIADPLLVHKGPLVYTLPHPRETFTTPLKWGVKNVAIVTTEPVAGFGGAWPLDKRPKDFERIVESGKMLGINVRSWTIMRSDGSVRPYGSPEFETIAPFRDSPMREIREEITRRMNSVRYSTVSEAEIDAFLAEHGYGEEDREIARQVLVGEKHRAEEKARFEALPLQERYPLVAAHGMSQAALKKALKSGTLLMPSVGVAQAGTGWTQAGYTDSMKPGKAFVMFAKETLTGEKSDMYSNDAFTPTINDLIEAGVVTSDGDIPDAPTLEEKIAALREAFNKDLKGLERITNLDEEALRKDLYELPDYEDEDIAGLMGQRKMLEAKLWRRVPLEEAKAVILVGLDPDLAKSLRDKGLNVVELPEGAKWYTIAEAERASRFSVQAWDPSFPQVLTVTNPDTLINKNAELHKSAKAGSVRAADELVKQLLGPATVGAKGKPSPKHAKIRALCAAHPTARVVPVIALEASGHNMLPWFYARHFAEIGGIKFDDRIRQTVKANHTGANAVERMASRAEFSGKVIKGEEYIICDDVVTQGGTLNELRKYIQSRGGKVVAATTLTAAQFSATLRISETKVQQLFLKFGEIDELLKEAGIANGTAELTESEARELLKCSPDTLRTRLAEQIRRRSEGLRDRTRDGSEHALQRLTQGELRLSISSAAAIDELPGLLGYFDNNGNMYPTRFAKAKEFNHPISRALNSLLDDLLNSDRNVTRLFSEKPEAEAEKVIEGWLRDYIDAACRSEEIGSCHKRMMEGYPKESYKADRSEHNRIVAEMTAGRITVSINDALKAKNAKLIAKVNALRPELPPIATDGTGSYAPSKDRICHIVIGPPAAGKSEVFANRLSLYHRARIVDCDIAKSRLRHFDGGFGANYVHEASSEVWDDVFRSSLERGENIVVPIVGAKEKSVVARIEACHRAGYMVYLHLNELPILQAYTRSLIRCLNTGRYINPQVLIDCGEKPTAVYKKIVERKETEDATGTGEADRGGSVGSRRAREVAYDGAATAGAQSLAGGQGGVEGRSGRLPQRNVALPDHYDHFSNNVPLGSPPDRRGGDYREPAYPDANTMREREVRNPQSLGGQYILPGFEQLARRAVSASILDDEEDAKERALVNYVAYFRLAHGPKPSMKTLARLGLSVGMHVVRAGKIYKEAESLAERMRGTIVEKAAKNGDVATASALMNREHEIDGAVESLISGGVSAGAKLTHSGVGQINSLLKKRVEQMMRDFTAASLADMEGETGLDIAAEILANDPNAFAGEVKKARGVDPNAESVEDGGDDTGGDGGGDENLTDYQRFQRDQARKEAVAKVERFIAQAKERAAERRARNEERRRRAQESAGGEDGGGGGDGGSAPGEFSPAASAAGNDNAPKNTVAGFKTKEEFAAFMRVWAADRFKREHGHSTLAQAEQDRLFAEFYRITVRKELSDLADKLLAPRGARAHVNRRLQEMEKGVRPDTIERMSASIFAFINAAAIRESRVELVKAFKKEIKETYAKGKFYEDLKLDSDRRVTGWVEEAARYICHVCDLSTREINGNPSQLAEERRKLQEIIDRREKVYEDSGKELASAHKEDMETKRAYAKMALLEKYGAMTSLMPGQILDLQHEAHEYLKAKAVELDNIWRDTRAYEDDIRKKLTLAIRGPNGERYEEKGWLNGRLFDALNGLLRLRLKHLTRFASDKAREEANDAINNIIVMLGDGETAYARALQGDRQAFFAGLAQIFQRPDGGTDNAAIKRYLARMTEKIPPELARQLSMQGFSDTMTYGQMLQLLVSLEQHSYDEAIRENGREGQAELIRSFQTTDEKGRLVKVLSEADIRFVEWIRAFYAAKREVLSPIMMRMVGQEVSSPDPLYAPVRMSMDDRARGLHTDTAPRWDPISAVMTRRVQTTRDFDESASIVGMFFDRSNETAKMIAWAERGSVLRAVFTSVGVQSAIRRAFGAGELSKILTQLEATFNGGESRTRTPGELAAVDKALNFTTYAYLGFNPLSAAKQTTSFTVWANALPGGFKDLWRYMTHFDKAAWDHIRASEQYKVRYGDDIGSGQDLATKGLYQNPSANPIAQFFSSAGMKLLKIGDFAPGGWIAQGLYKDLLNRHMSEGMEYEAADRLALTETFNLIEETQQSGRTYNTNMLTIEHGRIGRLLTQFATSPLQQLQYETQAWREWRDMVRYKMDEKRIASARQRFIRAAIINHVCLPVALNLVTAMFKAAMGDEPPWEKDGWHWTLLTELLLGQFSRIFFLGAFAQTTLTALFTRQTPRAGKLLPVEGVLGMGASAAITVHDLATLNIENLGKDLERAMKATAPTRIPYNLYRRLTGDSDRDRKRKKEAEKAK